MARSVGQGCRSRGRARGRVLPLANSGRCACPPRRRRSWPVRSGQPQSPGVELRRVAWQSGRRPSRKASRRPPRGIAPPCHGREPSWPAPRSACSRRTAPRPWLRIFLGSRRALESPPVAGLEPRAPAEREAGPPQVPADWNFGRNGCPDLGQTRRRRGGDRHGTLPIILAHDRAPRSGRWVAVENLPSRGDNVTHDREP